MTAPTTTTISVRGEAERTVSPDRAQLYTTVVRIGNSTVEATAAAKETTTVLLRALADLGGTALTVDTLRAPLTWSVQSVNTHEEYYKGPDGHGPTGRYICELTLQVTARDFGLLAEVTARLTGADDTRVNSVIWTVDADNADWGRVRADAIQAALRKGEDYAAALGGSVTAIDHVADAGLLGGDRAGQPQRAVAFSSLSSGGGPNELTLDPVPQVLTAIIDARFTATTGPLPGR